MSAAAAAAIAMAIKASGVLITVDPENFQAILNKAEKPLVVCATGGVFSKNFQYLTSYKGLAFFTKSRSPLELSLKVEVIEANKIWVP
ncbi:MAG TPA: hypothetical protein VKB46_15275 [Pyrinomonadaceae bacterium]|nr:hypothetical protein [Pyrinomonadaceae bacterium]